MAQRGRAGRSRRAERNRRITYRRAAREEATLRAFCALITADRWLFAAREELGVGAERDGTDRIRQLLAERLEHIQSCVYRALNRSCPSPTRGGLAP
jgi:hypothetical protein